MVRKALVIAPRETAVASLGVLVGWIARGRRDRESQQTRLALLRRALLH